MRERVVIVGKTRMGVGVCVGAIVERTGRAARLFPRGSLCHKSNTPFNLGDVWELNLQPRTGLDAPHLEDHNESTPRKVGVVPDLAAFIRRTSRPHTGEPDGLFGGLLRFRPSGTAYLARQTPLPAWSVQFWITPRVLKHQSYEHKARYILDGAHRFRIPYVGFEPSADFLPAGTLVRVSLARWWLNRSHPEEGETCALQLSGWFGVDSQPLTKGPHSSPPNPTDASLDDDHPF